ncbi:MAG: Cleavage polyadenylation factor subunit clp1 [Watsoniomyces obsoletus]|nr:MAG: Cleavage polyadenylation factor subunit clp1 [Watsoniomyces obsoletus]
MDPDMSNPQPTNGAETYRVTMASPSAQPSTGGPNIVVEESSLKPEQIPDFGHDDDDEDRPAQLEKVPKKKKKKSKSKKNKANQPSGFEENFADAPMTAAEFQEERDTLYNPSLSFAERIETCIQRYRARRKFDSNRKDVFDKYLSLGGVDAGPKIFSGGYTPGQLSELNSAQIQTQTATDFIGKDKDNENPIWVVDFESVAKCFLFVYFSLSSPMSTPFPLCDYLAYDRNSSTRVPYNWDLTTPIQVHYYVNIIRNFLNYILHHNVCPEYSEQVLATRRICDLAETELNLVREVARLMPGDYNVACSTQFEGYYKGMYTGDQDWAKELSVKIGLSDMQVKKVLSMALINVQGYTTEKAELVNHPENIHVLRKEDLSLEVTGIVHPDEDVKRVYAARSDPEMKPIGKIKARYWVNPFAVAEDVSDDGEEETDPFRKEELEFWLEEEILEKAFVGMKFESVVCQVLVGGGKGRFDDGVDQDGSVEQNGENNAVNGKGDTDTGDGYTLLFLDRVWAVYCSFYTNLPNEMMIGWKKPAPLERGAKKRAVMGRMGQQDENGDAEGVIEGEEEGAEEAGEPDE